MHIFDIKAHQLLVLLELLLENPGFKPIYGNPTREFFSLVDEAILLS